MEDDRGLFICRVENSRSFADALSARRKDLGLRQGDVEHDVGLTDGHLGKIESGGKSWGKFVLKMSQTANWLMERYGLALVVMDKDLADRLDRPMTHRQIRLHQKKGRGEPQPSSRSLTLRLVRRPDATPSELHTRR